MPRRSLYDTRFFIEYFYSRDSTLMRKLRDDLLTTRERLISVITIHEVYHISLQREGREVANLRGETTRRDFGVLDVDYEIAIRSAELRRSHRIPLADSIIAATAQIHRCPVVSDDPHFRDIRGLKVRWPS
jgi:predicted nucleic acid-binding protein